MKMEPIEIKIKELTCPPMITESEWTQIKTEIGDLVIARVVSVSLIGTLTFSGMKYDKEVMDLFARRIGMGPEEEEDDDDQEEWLPGENDWQDGEEDDRRFGPQGDWWKKK